MHVAILTHTQFIPTARRESPAFSATERDVMASLLRIGCRASFVPTDRSLRDIAADLDNQPIDAVWNLVEEMHDREAGDARFVAWLRNRGEAFTGCGSKAMRLSRDKHLAKALVKKLGLRVPDGFLPGRDRIVRVPAGLRYPLFVKSRTEDSSRGVGIRSLVKTYRQLLDRIDYLRVQWQTEPIVEEFIPGRDCYSGWMPGLPDPCLPAIELLLPLPTDFATEKVKWSLRHQRRLGASYRPAQGATGLQNPVRRVASALSLDGYARIDWRRTADGEWFFLEANPNPDFSVDGELATAARAAGIPHEELVRLVLNHAFERRNSDRSKKNRLRRQMKGKRNDRSTATEDDHRTV
jgi:D-alanine-D-alanine ligase